MSGDENIQRIYSDGAQKPDMLDDKLKYKYYVTDANGDRTGGHFLVGYGTYIKS